MKYLDRSANIAVLVAVAVFLTVIFGKQFATHKYPSGSTQALIGKSVGLSKVDLGGNQLSFVLALSTSCHYCKESLPFYKRLSQQSEGKVGVIAMLPQSYIEDEKYIQQAGIAATKIVSTNLNSVGVYATPTVLLVNGKGEIESAWVGMLDDRTQQQVLSHINHN